MANSLTATQIVDLLAVKHGKDVFVRECKDGPTWGTSHLRMDGWAMKRSWSNPVTWGYEVKVSRADFLADDKWQGYLPCCNRFAFVCPYKMIAPEEVPPQAGLIWVARTGTRLYTKRKAEHRDVEIPETLWRYLVMCRTRIVHDAGWEVDKARDFRKWLADKRENKRLGRHVAYATHRILRDAQDRAAIAESRMRGYDTFKDALKAAGINPNASFESWTVGSHVARLKSDLPPGFDKVVSGAINQLKQIRTWLAENGVDDAN